LTLTESVARPPRIAIRESVARPPASRFRGSRFRESVAGEARGDFAKAWRGKRVSIPQGVAERSAWRSAKRGASLVDMTWS
jgi:hypothetical protein